MDANRNDEPYWKKLNFSLLTVLFIVLFFNCSYGQIQETEVQPAVKTKEAGVTIQPSSGSVKIKSAKSSDKIKVVPHEGGAVMPAHKQDRVRVQPITRRRKSTSMAIPSQMALQLAESEKESFGFERVYFDAEGLDKLMAYPGVTGVRFYTAIPKDSEGKQTIIAVAINKQGEDIGEYLSSWKEKLKKLKEKEASEWVQRSEKSMLSTISCTFTKKEILNLMTAHEATGIFIKPGIHDRDKSFILSSAKVDSGNSINIRTEYLLGTAPCPNVCGGVVLGQHEDN